MSGAHPRPWHRHACHEPLDHWRSDISLKFPKRAWELINPFHFHVINHFIFLCRSKGDRVVLKKCYVEGFKLHQLLCLKWKAFENKFSYIVFLAVWQKLRDSDFIQHTSQENQLKLKKMQWCELGKVSEMVSVFPEHRALARLKAWLAHIHITAPQWMCHTNQTLCRQPDLFWYGSCTGNHKTDRVREKNPTFTATSLQNHSANLLLQ